MCANFQAKSTTLIFLAQICPKMDLCVGTSKIKLRIWNHDLQDTTCANFQEKRKAFKVLHIFRETFQLRAIFWFL